MRTDRLILRRWRKSDDESLFRYAADPEVGTNAGWPPHKSLEESREVIDTLFNNDQTWAVALKDSDEAIGCIGYLLPGSSHMPMGEDEVEVGYWIGKPYWNQGLCSEALRALVNFCFDEKRCSAIWGCHFVDNPASGRVMEKCGFGETCCPNLQEDNGRPMRVMRIEKRNTK